MNRAVCHILNPFFAREQESDREGADGIFKVKLSQGSYFSGMLLALQV